MSAERESEETHAQQGTGGCTAQDTLYGHTACGDDARARGCHQLVCIFASPCVCLLAGSSPGEPRLNRTHPRQELRNGWKPQLEAVWEARKVGQLELRWRRIDEPVALIAQRRN